MAKRSEEVIGIIDALGLLKATIAATPEVVAEEFLMSTLVDEPRPPVRTGALRRSGAVYIGNRLYMRTTDLLSVDHLLYPNGEYAESGRRLQEQGMSLSEEVSPRASLRSRNIESSVRARGTLNLDNLRGKVSVVYENPIAAVMHEWQGKFSDSKSGAHFVSAKAARVKAKSQTRLKQIWTQESGRIKRR